MPPGRDNNEDIAIFWDYENCPAPSNSTGYDLVDAIRRMAQQFGSVKLFKAYLEVSEQILNSRSLSLRSELQVSGVSLTDCPHNGRKDAADKMMLVDMLAHAIDHPAPRTFLLISGDRDFAYALSTLRLRSYRVILVTLPHAHVSLKSQASTCLDWFADVVGTITCLPQSPKKTVRTINPRSEDNNSGRFSNLNVEENRKLPKKKYTGENNSPFVDKQTDEFKMEPTIPTQMYGSPPKSPKKKSQFYDAQTATQYWEQAELRQTFQPPQRPPLRPLWEATDKLTRTPPSPVSNQSSELDIPRRTGQNIDRLVDSGLSQSGCESDDEASSGSPTLFPPTTPPRVPLEMDEPFITNEGTKPGLDVMDDENLRRVVPDPFKALVRQLQWYHFHANYIVLRSIIGADLTTRYKGVYKRANVKKFTDYAQLAEKAGIVELGGTGGEAWIRMCPGWEKADTRW